MKPFLKAIGGDPSFLPETNNNIFFILKLYLNCNMHDFYAINLEQFKCASKLAKSTFMKTRLEIFTLLYLKRYG